GVEHPADVDGDLGTRLEPAVVARGEHRTGAVELADPGGRARMLARAKVFVAAEAQQDVDLGPVTRPKVVVPHLGAGVILRGDRAAGGATLVAAWCPWRQRIGDDAVERIV